MNKEPYFFILHWTLQITFNIYIKVVLLGLICGVYPTGMEISF